MASNAPTTRERLHRMVDDLSERQLAPALAALEDLALSVTPPDDEPVTDADRAALVEAWEDVRAGRVHTVEEAFGPEPRS